MPPLTSDDPTADQPWATVRFWQWVNDSPVRLTLRDGQTLTHTRQYQHEEGWTLEIDTWTYHHGQVRHEYTETGRDCDGRHRWESTGFCRREHLAAHHTEHGDAAGVSFPDWGDVDIHRRDYAAEAVGY